MTRVKAVKSLIALKTVRKLVLEPAIGYHLVDVQPIVRPEFFRTTSSKAQFRDPAIMATIWSPVSKAILVGSRGG
jgi:hypothetical protein